MIKYVQLKDEGKLSKLVGYGYVPVPKNVIVEGIISEPEGLAKLVKKELKEPPWGKITAEHVVASLPESKLFTRIIDLPSVKDADIDEAIFYEVEQSVPIPINDLYTDWQIIGEEKDKVSIFLAAAPKSIVNSHSQFLKELGLEPIALEVSLASIARSIIPKKEQKVPSIIIDIGAKTTNMAVFDENLQITESNPIGADTIKESLTTVGGLDSKTVNSKVAEGLKENDKTSEIIKNDLKKIILEIERLQKYYKERGNKKDIKRVILCGGIGSMNGLSEYIQQESKIETFLGNPWTNISVYPLKPVPKKEAAMYSTAIGLCLRGVKDE